jgi:NitT/TauT family transport system permease protein
MRITWVQPSIAWPAGLRPNIWDLPAFALVFGLLSLLALGGAGMSTPYELGDPIPISLDPEHLPYYALRTVLRMFIALGVSLVFSVIYAAAAAKSRRAEKILIPLLDILQSVPILGFLSITVTGFIALFPGSLLGVECASIFAIFTSQAWNMTFSMFQSFRTVPIELREAARMYHVGAWKTFWRLDVPHAMPNLVWNMMMSVSGGWFFVVASEAITVSSQTIMLPGVGSYIATAIEQRNLEAIGWAIAIMFAVILAYDQLLFRPLLAWADKFKPEQGDEDVAGRPWFLTMLQKARIVALGRWLGQQIYHAFDQVLRRLPTLRLWPTEANGRPLTRLDRAIDLVWDAVLAALVLWVVWRLATYISASVGWDEVGRVMWYGVLTSIRVIVLIAVASVIWVPLGVWIGLRPQLAKVAQPIVQFMAAFPANLFFPLAVVVIVKAQLDPEIWLSPLMILGTQWYIAFNVIGGASALPKDLHYVADNLGVTRWLWWRRLILPGIFPAYITGAVTAAGGSWNAAIVSEVVSWGDTKLAATGVGAYIAQATQDGDFPRLVLGIAVLCGYVILFNRLFWRRLYDLAAEKLRLD